MAIGKHFTSLVKPTHAQLGISFVWPKWDKQQVMLLPVDQALLYLF